MLTSSLWMLLLLMLAPPSSGAMLSSSAVSPPRQFPKQLLIGYVSECNQKAPHAVRMGVNVLIWSFWGYHASRNEIHASFNMTCVKAMKEQLNHEGYTDVVFLASTGGWNGGHLQNDDSHDKDALTIYKAWIEWGGDVFDGFDFDLEGNNNLTSPYNEFTVKCLDTMGEMSRLAKQDGYQVSIVPPQSYLDFGTSRFSRFVNLTHPTQFWHGDFSYYGANVYAHTLAKYGDSIDLIMIQLYESYARALHEVSQFGLSPSEYLIQFIDKHVARGEQYFVQFEDDASVGLASQLVSVPLSKLVIGLANGWASSSSRSLYISPAECGKAYQEWMQHQEVPRGFMYWTINQEGEHGVDMAKGLNEFLHTRRINNINDTLLLYIK